MIWHSLRRNRLGMLGLVLLGGIVLMAVFANWLAPYDPSKLTGQPFESPSAAHWLGTNDIGQDIFSELIYGARVSLLIGVLAAAIAIVIGTTVGLLAGYRQGPLGAGLMRLVDVVLVIPFLPLMVLLAAYLGQSIWNLVIVIGLLIWARPARVIRSQVLSLTERDYVLASRVVGAKDNRILVRAILPGVLSLALAQFVLAASGTILLEASLSFLGLGDPTQKSWGTILFYAQARNAFLTGAWLWWVLPTGLMITLTVVGFALIGFAMEEALNPRLKASRAIAVSSKPAPKKQSNPGRATDTAPSEPLTSTVRTTPSSGRVDKIGAE
ncbi:MAG: ABC transporter permease [Anaerolineae bacterium]|nr:ABC transporter permease [Anaerolineae bacterium]